MTTRDTLERLAKRAKYRDFADMPPNVLAAFARDLCNPKESLRRIRSAAEGEKE